MSARRPAAALVLALALAGAGLAAPAAAQFTVGSTGVIVGFGQGRSLGVTQAPVTVSGGLTVTFHSDPATCEAVGRCGLDGTVSWRPAHRARLIAIEVARGRRREVAGYLIAIGESPAERGVLTTVARVRRTGPDATGLCADGSSNTGSLEVAGPPSAVEVGFESGDEGADLLSTRCAGPLPGDLGGALPVKRLTLSALRRGRTAIDLGVDRPFASAGLAGTVQSDVVVRVGPAHTSRGTERSRPPAGVRLRRERSLEAGYRVERVSGRLVVDVRGDPDPDVCAALDACGLRGAVTVTPRPRKGTAFLDARAPAARPARLLRAALGLVPGGAASGVETYGIASWTERGLAEVGVSRPGDAPCLDRRSLGQGTLSLGVHGKRVRVLYLPGLGTTAALRTRCPGPPADAPLATGTVALRAFGARRVTVRLHGGARIDSDGYRLRPSGDLTVVLRRTRLRERVTSEPDLS